MGGPTRTKKGIVISIKEGRGKGNERDPPPRKERLNRYDAEDLIMREGGKGG